MPGQGLKGHNYATQKFYDKRFPGNQEFRGVDGEGGNVPDESTLFGELRHQYLSLRVGPYLLETGSPLTYRDCFGFLADQPRTFQYVAYFFDYDVTMMIRTLPERIAKSLLNRIGRTTGLGNTHPVVYDGFEFDYMPHKEFRIRRQGQRHFIIINDVGQFFQGPFLSTLKKWNIGTPEEQEFIRKGKSMRADFAGVDDEIRAYNALECLLLEQLMTDFRGVCLETGYLPRKWQGPGFLASAMLEYHHVPRRDTLTCFKDSEFRRFAQAGYYGGRFETTATGPVPGHVWQYDINGAYVYMLTTLPCLTHGTWRRVRERPSGGTWIGKVRFNHTPGGFLYNLPFRLKNGNIYCPRAGTGVYWSVEIEAAERAGTEIEYIDGWVYEAHCECRWFDFVFNYYRERLRLGKSTKGFVLKLAGNSIYGKIAQSIGYAPYANPVWAGLITAGCRATLIDAYAQAPGECYMLATDGLFMGCELDLPISKNLGEWDLTEHPDGIFIVQPGIYFTGAEAKSRGVERGRIGELREHFENKWDDYLKEHGGLITVDIPVDNFITAKQALARGKWQLAGIWEHTTREVSFNTFTKRAWGYMVKVNGVWRTKPQYSKPEWESTPYNRVIGGGLMVADSDRYTDPALQERARMDEQPDWVEPLLDFTEP